MADFNFLNSISGTISMSNFTTADGVAYKSKLEGKMEYTAQYNGIEGDERVHWTFKFYLRTTDGTQLTTDDIPRIAAGYQYGDSDDGNFFGGSASDFTIDKINSSWAMVGQDTYEQSLKYYALPQNSNTLKGTITIYDATGKWWRDYGSETINWQLHIYNASTVTATHANIGDKTSIKVSNERYRIYNNKIPLKHSVYYSFDGGTTIEKIGDMTNYAPNTNDVLSWTVPYEYYAKIPNAKRGIIYIYVDTFDGNTSNQIGTRQYTTFWAYAVEDDCVPTIDPTLYDVNQTTISLTGNKNVLINEKSSVTYKANAASRNYATIKSIEASNGGNSVYGETGTFEKVTDDVFYFYVTDSRGYTTVVSRIPDMIPYIIPTCNVEAENPTTDGTLSFTVKGLYYNGSFGQADNTLTVKYRYKELSGEFTDWLIAETNIAERSYISNVNLTGLDYFKIYQIEAQATDVFGTVYSNSESVTAVPVFDWGPGDMSINVDTAVHGTLVVNGDIVCTGAINGEAGSGIGGICFGICETDAVTSAKFVSCGTFTNLAVGASIRVKFAYGNSMAQPSLSVNGTSPALIKRFGTTSDMMYMWQAGEVKDFVYDGQYWMMVDGGATGVRLSTAINNSDEMALTPSAVYALGIESGEWTPVLSQPNAVSSYNVRRGWYQKIGNVVTIGFNVSIVTKSGYHGTTIGISGVPYTPAYAAFGGGVAYNVHTPANQIFEGWIIDTSGNISARTQTETKDAASNLTIGSAVYYTSGSDNMTIAGTICYMTA